MNKAINVEGVNEECQIQQINKYIELNVHSRYLLHLSQKQSFNKFVNQSSPPLVSQKIITKMNNKVL